jgi:hypothetical protein
MPSTTSALLCIWHDVETDYVEEYLRWHSFEHLPERLALPGFVSAERYQLIEGPGQRFGCFLEVENRDAFRSSAYQARLDAPTEWTRRLMPRYSRVHRALCRKQWDIGNGMSGLAACLRIASNGNTALKAELRAICAALLVEHEIMRARFAELDQALTSLTSEEKRLRRSEDAGGYDLVVLLDALSIASLRSVADDLAASLHGQGLRHEFSIYGLSCSLKKDG